MRLKERRLKLCELVSATYEPLSSGHWPLSVALVIDLQQILLEFLELGDYIIRKVAGSRGNETVVRNLLHFYSGGQA